MHFSRKTINFLVAAAIVAVAAIPYVSADEVVPRERITSAQWTELVIEFQDQYSAKTLLGGTSQLRFEEELKKRNLTWSQFRNGALAVREGYIKHAQQPSSMVMLMPPSDGTPQDQGLSDSRDLDQEIPMAFQLVETLTKRLLAER